MILRSINTWLLASSLVVTGCSTAVLQPYRDEADKIVDEASSAATTMKTGRPVATSQSPSVQHIDGGVYIPVRKIAVSKTFHPATDPALQRQITVNRSFSSAQEIAERITGLTGIPAIVAPDVAQVAQNAIGLPQQAAAGLPLPQGMSNAGLPTPLPNAGGQGTFSLAAQQPGGFPVSLSYAGSLSGFLDVACARIGIAWEMRDGQIRLFRHMSRTFRLMAMPGDTSMDAKIGTSSSDSGTSGTTSTGGGTSSNSTQNAGVNFSGLSVWKSIEDSIRAMLTQAQTGGVGGKVVTSPALGTVTVTDTPAVVAEVEKFIDAQNVALSKQVVVNVRVLAVELTDSNNYGIDWDAVYKNLTSGIGFTFKTATTAITGAGSLGMSVLGAADGAKETQWSGTNALITALETQGKVTTVTSAMVTTMNNQPAPILIGRATSYVANSTTSITSGVSTTSMSTGTVNSGFSMSILPHIIEGRRLMMQYALDISSLLKLSTITAGDSVIQTPDVERRNSLQRVMVNSGDTIVMAGFENREVAASTQGVASAQLPALGGSVLGSNKRNVLVLLIEPVVSE